MSFWRRFMGGRVALSADQRRRVAALRRQAVASTEELKTGRFIVVDSESTGLDTRHDRPLSIGAVAIEGGRIHLDRSFLRVLRQEKETSRENIVIHGISPAQQVHGMDPAEALLDFLEFAAASPRIAFHAAFDRELLGNEARRRLGLKAEARWLDLALLLPALFPEAKPIPPGLDGWLAFFHLQIPDRHRADLDALMAAELALIAMKRAQERGAKDFGGMMDLARTQAELNQAKRTGGLV